MQYRIVAVHVDSPGTHEHHITLYKLENGQILTRDDILIAVSFENPIFYTDEDGYRVNVILAHDNSGKAYIKTRPDAVLGNNLLNLPKF